MKHSELSQLSADLCGNSNYVSLNDRPDLIQTVMDSEHFSHVSQRDRFSLCIYYHCEGSPSGCQLFASIDIENAKKLEVSKNWSATDTALLYAWQ
jgi:hypothetical protein